MPTDCQIKKTAYEMLICRVFELQRFVINEFSADFTMKLHCENLNIPLINYIVITKNKTMIPAIYVLSLQTDSQKE